METIAEIKTIQELQHLVTSGFTDWKQYSEVWVKRDGDLLLFDYTAKAQYAARWNFFERISRGLIVNSISGEIVARPFDKFFNWFEGGRKAGRFLLGKQHIVSITEKIDGSLAILYRVGKPKVYRNATRGDFHSAQAEWATDFLNAHHDLSGLPDELTLLFEIVYPENRIVVDYGAREELVLLAARNRLTGAYLPFFRDVYELAQRYNFSLPQVYSFNNVTEILDRTGILPPDAEGYVVEFSDGERYKFKGDRYLELHKLISGLSFKHTLEAMQSGRVEYIRSQVPEEHLVEFNAWVEQIELTVAATEQRVHAIFDQAPKATRKEYALWVQAQHKEDAPYLFALLDGKNIVPLIYRMEFVEALAAES